MGENRQDTTQSSGYARVSCGHLTMADEGRRVSIAGWVHRRRDQGALIFVDLRDRDGMTQIVFNRETNPAAHSTAEELRSEFVVRVEGTVVPRGADRVNPNLKTGEIEVVTDSVAIL